MKEKLAALVVSLKENKSKAIAIGVVALVVIVAIVLVLTTLLGRPSYKTTIKKFAQACKSEEKMEKFVKKYVDLRAIYAMKEADDPEDFKDEYKNAKKDDYKDDDFVDDVKDSFKKFVSEDEKIKVDEIGKLKDYDDDCKQLKKAKVTLKNDDGDDLDVTIIFYKGKMVSMTYAGMYDLLK